MQYRGTLEDFVLSKEDGIDRLYLSDVYRRELSKDRDQSKEVISTDKHLKISKDSLVLRIDKGEAQSPGEGWDERYYSIPGNRFVLPFREIKNLNIFYVFLEEEDSMEQENSDDIENSPDQH